MPSQCTINGTKYELVEEERFKAMEAMIRSAFAVADRKGRNTDWRRFKQDLEEIARFEKWMRTHTYWMAGPAYPPIEACSSSIDPYPRTRGTMEATDRLSRLEEVDGTITDLLHKWFDEKTEIKNDFDKLELRVHALESGGIIDFIGEDTLKDLKDRIKRLEAFPCVGHTRGAKELGKLGDDFETVSRDHDTRLGILAARLNALESRLVEARLLDPVTKG